MTSLGQRPTEAYSIGGNASLQYICNVNVQSLRSSHNLKLTRHVYRNRV
jgi:hypothetical protein